MSFNKPKPDPVIKKLDIKDWDEYLVGTFKKDDKSIEDSIANTVARFEKLVPNIKKSSKILIISNGHMFLPIYIATRYGCKIFIICRTEAELKSVQKDIKKYKLEDTVTVEVKDFHLTQFDYDYFDMAWSVNTLHSEAELMPVLREIRRILVPQGRFILCEHTSDDEATQESIGAYSHKTIEREANKADFEKVYLKDFVKESNDHYTHLLSQVKAKKKEADKVSGMLKLVQDEKLVWTFMQFQKRNA